MSTFDILLDSPKLLRNEALNTTISFTKTGSTTGRINWNIPSPAAGCSAATQAYCGMLVVIDTIPSSAQHLPVDREVYTSDPTVDQNLFVGDKIGTSLVVGAFYNDRVTTSINVTGLSADTAYYVTGYPCDCEYRYYIEGIHAYSLDISNGAGKDGRHGYQQIILNRRQGVQQSTYTGLQPTVNYNFQIQIGILPGNNTAPTPYECQPTPPMFNITVNGSNAAMYSNLIQEFNKQLSLVDNPYQNQIAPNTGALYWDGTNLHTWNGTANVLTPVINQQVDPTILTLGTYWYDNLVLKEWSVTNSWTTVTNVITSDFDPLSPIADQSYWINTTVGSIQGYSWNGVNWCTLNTIVSTIDPSIKPVITPGSYWYDTNTNVLYNWDNSFGMWTATSALISPTDPSLLPVNSYWFNTNTNSLLVKDIPTVGWNQAMNTVVSNNIPATPTNRMLWYNTTTLTLRQYSNITFNWTSIPVITLGLDPTQRYSCELWWNSATNHLYSYDIVNGVWKQVVQFLIQNTDPTNIPVLTYNSIWYNPTTHIAQAYLQNCFKPITAIYSTVDPTIKTDGEIWYNTSTNVWRKYDIVNSIWNQIHPILLTLDPDLSIPANATTFIGTFWLNPTSHNLNYWNGMGWVTVSFSQVSPAPTKGTLWFNTTTNLLLSWDGTSWISATPRAIVDLDCNGNLLFIDNVVGSLSFIDITDRTLFNALVGGFEYGYNHLGGDEVSDKPSWTELGVGTDGNNDVRLLLANEIRYSLGYPVVDVELSVEQLDFAITTALSELRAKSGLGYKSGYFFLHTTPNESKYLLTNKASGANKIVDILSIQRVNSLASGGHDSGIYGQIFANFLYNAGNFDLLSYHLMTEYKKTYEILFAQRIQWIWHEQARELHLMQRMPYNLYLAVECTMERTEQDIMTDRYVVPWIRRYATALARIMLAEIRGKYSMLPGAGGGITLNANDLRMAAKDELTQCLEEIDNFLVDNPGEYGMSSSFLFG